MSVEGTLSGALGGFRLDARFSFPGEGITALSGPSGSGKTTLLRAIAGLARFEGRLVVDGETWQDVGVFVPTHRRAVGVVFQEASLLPHLSVAGNLRYGAKRAKGEAGLADAVELLGLSALMGRGVGGLSGGERQRVALARALVTRPRLLLLDEPLASLDAAAKAEILPYLERVHRSLKVPALYVTHDAGEIARLADRVLHMDGGRIIPGAAMAEPSLDGLDAAARDALALAALRAGLGEFNRMTETPKILRGGPEIPTGDGDPPVQAYIEALPGWRSDVCRRLDRVIIRTVSGVKKAVKWNAPIYGAPGGRSWFLSITGYENFVRVTFFDGTMLRPPPPTASKFEAIRYYDIREGKLDEAEFAGWVEQAAVLPGWTP